MAFLLEERYTMTYDIISTDSSYSEVYDLASIPLDQELFYGFFESDSEEISCDKLCDILSRYSYSSVKSIEDAGRFWIKD